MTTGLIWAGGILIAMGWFAIGWVARGQENRHYAESRLRHLAQQAVVAHREPLAYHPRWDVERVPAPAPAVVHVHLTAPVLAPRGQPAGLPVVEGQLVHELPAGWS